MVVEGFRDSTSYMLAEAESWSRDVSGLRVESFQSRGVYAQSREYLTIGGLSRIGILVRKGRCDGEGGAMVVDMSQTELVESKP